MKKPNRSIQRANAANGSKDPKARGKKLNKNRLRFTSHLFFFLACYVLPSPLFFFVHEKKMLI